MDRGLEEAGHTCAWQCESDEWRRALLERRFGRPVYADVRDLRGDAVQPVDLLCGGFPCQDLSVAGQRRGIEEGERSGLFFAFSRLAAGLGDAVTVPVARWIGERLTRYAGAPDE
jgi:DNA (cytosine-5)-methyltransferase 1